MLDPRGIIEDIGNPEFERILMAAALAAGLSENVRQAAHSTEWAPEVVFYTLLDDDPAIREEQLLSISRIMGSDSESQVRALLSASGPVRAEHRLPLVEMAFPALKRRPQDFIADVLKTVEALSKADEHIDVFEYLLARVIARDLWESSNPHAARSTGNRKLSALRSEALTVMAVLARHGHQDADTARAAFEAGVSALGNGSGAMDESRPGDWASALDEVLPKLDQLRPKDKQRLVEALIAVVLHDGRLEPTELELLRVVCELIHVPLPMLHISQRS